MGGHDRWRRLRLGAGALAAAAVVVVLATLLGGGESHRATTSPATNTSQSATSTTPPTPPTSPPVGPPAQPPPSTEGFGADVGGLFTGAFTPTQINVQLKALRDTGATIARAAAYWEAAEPTAPVDGVHRYDWTSNDFIAQRLAVNGLQWLPIIAFAPAWANSVAGEDHSPPSMDGDYAAYAAAFAARYGASGSFWSAHPDLPAQPVRTYEIWNEPDNPAFWRPRPDPSRFAELYLRAREAITAVDPTARVIVGGLWHPDGFLPAMLDARPDLRGHIDGVAIHPYANNPEGVLTNVRKARDLLRSLGLGGLPLYVTEFGWTTRPPGALDYLPAQLRPAYISRTIAALGHTDCGVAISLLFAWVSSERNPSKGGDWFGIRPPNGSISDDMDGFVAGVRQATGPGSRIPLCSAR